MSEPDYVVIRRAADLPAEFNIGDLDGKWFDRSRVPVRAAPPDGEAIRRTGMTYSEAVATPTGRFEVRDDGAVAEVWEFRA